MYRGADKSLAGPGKKQATATKLLLLQATQKKFRRLSAQPDFRGSNDLHVGRKIATFQWFFSHVGLRTYQHPCKNELYLRPSFINNKICFFQFCVSVHHIMISKNTSLMQLISIYFTYSKSLHVSGRTLPIIRRI